MKHAYLTNLFSTGTIRYLLLVSLAILLKVSFVHAQDCNNNCIGTLQAPVNITLNTTCDATILKSMVVPDTNACPGPKTLVIRDSLNRLLGQGVDAVPLEGDTLVGRRVTVTVTDQATGSICVGHVRLFDNSPPVLGDCPEVTISCLEDSSPTAIGIPSVTDNCSANLIPTFIDEIIPRDCLSDTASVVLRQWSVDDGNGQTASCTQRINIIRASVMDVTFPADQLISCDDSNADPMRTGVPQLSGMPLMQGDLCGLLVQYQDDTIFICQDYTYRIDREWIVTERCTAFSDTSTQVINVGDLAGPTITCPNPSQLVFSTDPGECGATITLPQATAVDNCGSQINFEVTTSYGTSGFDPVSGVGPGRYQVNYFATDECSNMRSSCGVTLTVVDDVQPTANCDDLVNVSLNSSGVGLLAASIFDEGSSDNCVSPVFLKVRRTEIGACNGMNGDDSNRPGMQEWFDDRVVFCCEDVGAMIGMTLRVYEIDPGAGPVNPDRETGSGNLVGHFTECNSLVQVKDGRGPVFASCPADITIQCIDEIDNLSIYGSPGAVTDNCGSTITIDSTVTRTLDDCQRGTIVRQWVANGTATCEQIITIENNQPLPETSITWPLDYTTTECGADLSLENLPPAYREPTISEGGCENLAINMTEDLFDRAEPACFKILRTWTVIDWCHYELGSEDSTGFHKHIQQLKVNDNTSPEINCPDPIEVNVSANCVNSIVILPEPTATDCSGQITITNNSIYADIPGAASANGTYPVGTHEVQFIAADGCGLATACTTTITVKDMQAPELACKSTLTVTLMPLSEGGARGSLSAIDFVASSRDNCDPADLIKHSIRRLGSSTTIIPTATEILFACDDIGPVTVEVFARDNSGNAVSCTSIVTVDNHSVACEGQADSDVGMIAGAILTEDGIEVENVSIRVVGPTPDMQYTGIDGSFQFDNLATGTHYTVSPEMNEDLLNGVTTMDLVLMSKHIIGTQVLDTPYKIIAADIDRSGHVSTLDIIRLRKMILHIDGTFPNNNKAWRFIDASYEFADPTNPFLGYFPEIYNVNELIGDEMHADFIAIKVGDVNGSAQANSIQSGGGRNLPYSLELQVANQSLALDDVIDIPVRARYMNEWSGYQFTLEFDPNSLEVVEIIPGELPNLYADENFNLFDLESGLISTIWHEFDVSADSREMVLFSLRCQVKKVAELKDVLYVSSRVTEAEAVSEDGELGTVSISFDNSTAETGATFELYQNRPNPWTNSTIIPFELDLGGDASLTIYDMAGKQVYQTAANYSAGYHEISISRNELPSVGLFYYTLESGDQRATRKMVLAD